MRDVFRSIRRTPYQSLAAFLVLFLTLFLSTVLFMTLSFFYGLLGYVEGRPQVTVYFQTNTPESEIFKIRDELIGSGKAASVKYLNKDEAFRIYKELNKDNPLLLEMVSSDILPPSLEIFAKKPVYLSEIAEYLKKQPATDEVQFQKNIVDRLLSLTGLLRKASIILFSYLLVLSIIVLSTMISFKIALKKDEIELLRLLGATKFYIQKPFLIEGLLFGLGSSLFSFMLLFSGLLYAQPFLMSYLRGIPHLILSVESYQLTVWPLGAEFLTITFALSALFGILLSEGAIFLSTRKYLK